MFLANQCINPPPSLQKAVSVATRIVDQYVTDIDRPTVCMNDSLGIGIGGRATPGVVYLKFQDLDEYSPPTAYWMAEGSATVLHEVLHQYGWRYGFTQDDLWLEEGVTEAVTQDLLPTFLRRLGALQNRSSVAYPSAVKAVRVASAKETHSKWTSVSARKWRRHLLATPPSQRILP